MVLVAGGAGFVGSHVVKALRSAGEDVLVLDDLSRGHRSALQGCPLVQASIHDRGSVVAALRESGADAVLHFAAFIEVGEAEREPGRYWHNNAWGTMALLAAMREAGVGRVVFSSTAAVYGSASDGPIPESAPLVPEGVYAASKLAAERCVAASGAAWAALRYFNACGADPEGVLGEDHRPETHLLPLAIEAAMGRRTLQVFGDDYPTPDGTCVRDYVHVHDLARAHVLALQALREGREVGAVNLGTGRGSSVREVLAAVEEVSGRRVPHELAGRRPGDPPSLVAEPGRAGAVLGWQPEFAGLRDAVAHAWAWRTAHPDGYPD